MTPTQQFTYMYWYVEPSIGLHILLVIYLLVLHTWRLLFLQVVGESMDVRYNHTPTLLSVFLCLVPFCVALCSTVSKTNELKYPDSCSLCACASKIILAVC
ncbi:unnamed protein product [Ixodes pacificus]